MIKKRLTLINPKGLHARTSHRLSDTVNQFACQCHIAYGTRSADAHKIMSIMMLGAPMGCELEFTFTGRDAQACAEAVEELIADGLGELDERT